MNPPQAHCDEMAEQNFNSGFGCHDDCNGISISTVVSTSCLVLEGLRTNTVAIPPPVYDTFNIHSHSGAFHTPSPVYCQERDHGPDQSFCPAASLEATQLCSRKPTDLDYKNHIFESAASEFTTVGNDNNVNAFMPYNNNQPTQDTMSRSDDYEDLSYRNYRQVSSAHYNIERTAADGLEANTLVPHEFGPLTFEEDAGFTDCNGFRVGYCGPHSADLFDDKNIASGHRNSFPDNMLSFERYGISENECGIENSMGNQQIKARREQDSNLNSQNECKSRLHSSYWVAGDDSTQHHDFLRCSSSDPCDKGQTPKQRNSSFSSLPLSDSIGSENCGSSIDCCLLSDKACPAENTSRQFSDITPDSKLYNCQKYKIEEAAGHSFEGKMGTQSCFYSQQGSYEPFPQADVAVNSCFSEQKMSFSTQPEKEGSDFNANSRLGQDLATYIEGEADNEADDDSSKKVANGKVKRKHAQTVESLQHQLEMLEEKRKKMATSCSSVNFLRQRGDAAGEKSDGGAAAVDVDHMICSGVTVAGFKPRAIIRKRSKTATPTDVKDPDYWQKRRKNNDSARKSRESKKEKERKFYKRALELEYENFYLQECLSLAEAELATLGHPFVPPVFGNHGYI